MDTQDQIKLRGRCRIVCRRADGSVRWQAENDNLIVNEGLDYMLDGGLAGGTQIAAWFVGLKGSGAPAPGDTMASHASWAEITDYDEAARPAWIPGAVSAQSVDNSGSVAVYNINATVTIDGAFVSSNGTKGGTAGTLFSVVTFTGGPRDAQATDTLEATYTYSSVDV